MNSTKKNIRKPEKYIIHEDFIIARHARKTLRYIEKNIENFPNKYIVLKNRIIDSCYNILEWIYRANIFQSMNDKKEIVVHIQMLNFYLEEALKKEIITPKKFLKYSSHVMDLDKMIRAWFKYEETK